MRHRKASVWLRARKFPLFACLNSKQFLVIRGQSLNQTHFFFYRTGFELLATKTVCLIHEIYFPSCDPYITRCRTANFETSISQTKVYQPSSGYIAISWEKFPTTKTKADTEYILCRLMQRYSCKHAFRRFPEPVLTGTPNILNELPCRFTHILQENTEIIISRLRNDVFLPYPFQFTVKATQFKLIQCR
jgi:hypothetical protein